MAAEVDGKEGREEEVGWEASPYMLRSPLSPLCLLRELVDRVRGCKEVAERVRKMAPGERSSMGSAELTRRPSSSTCWTSSRAAWSSGRSNIFPLESHSQGWHYWQCATIRCAAAARENDLRSGIVKIEPLHRNAVCAKSRCIGALGRKCTSPRVHSLLAESCLRIEGDAFRSAQSLSPSAASINSSVR